MGVAVSVAVDVGVAVGDGVSVAVAVAIGVAVEVSVGVNVAGAFELPPSDSAIVAANVDGVFPAGAVQALRSATNISNNNNRGCFMGAILPHCKKRRRGDEIRAVSLKC